MGLALAFKRVGRTYRTPLRRFAGVAGRHLTTYAVGFTSGILWVIAHPHTDWSTEIASVLEWAMAIAIALLIVVLGINLVMDAGAVDPKE
ncbi:MAG: hypothetical protein ABSH22_05075 [Tepidisphaeraceae bacterium]|jgi:hypothetical protein